MLVLSRRIDETLVIGNNIKVTVLGINGNQVRIGIDAPKDVVVDRLEVAQRKEDERNSVNAAPRARSFHG